MTAQIQVSTTKPGRRSISYSPTKLCQAGWKRSSLSSESLKQSMLVLGKAQKAVGRMSVFLTPYTRYCFGAPYVCNELAGKTCAAGAFAHPAFLKEHHFRQLKSMTLDFSIITADKCPQNRCFCRARKSTTRSIARLEMRRSPSCKKRRRLTTSKSFPGSNTVLPCVGTWITLTSVGFLLCCLGL